MQLKLKSLQFEETNDFFYIKLTIKNKYEIIYYK